MYLIQVNIIKVLMTPLYNLCIHVQTPLVIQCKLKLVVKTEKDVIFQTEQPIIPTERILQEPLCMQHSLSISKDQLH